MDARLRDMPRPGTPFGESGFAGERIYVPVRAESTVEHERSDDEEEIEFQIKWRLGVVGLLPALRQQGAFESLRTMRGIR